MSQITSKPDHGSPISVDQEGQQLLASQELQVFFDDLQLRTNGLIDKVWGTSTPMDSLTGLMDTFFDNMDSL